VATVFFPKYAALCKIAPKPCIARGKTAQQCPTGVIKSG
jgi:hypothetical protein